MRRWLAAIGALGASLGIAAQAQTPFAPRPAAPASIPGVPNAPNAPNPAANPPHRPRRARPGQVQGSRRPPEIVERTNVRRDARLSRARLCHRAPAVARGSPEGRRAGDGERGSDGCHAIGVPEDLAEAVRWFRRAAETGDMVGQFSLAFMYENGRGVPQNITEARRLYTLSANQGTTARSRRCATCATLCRCRGRQRPAPRAAPNSRRAPAGPACRRTHHARAASIAASADAIIPGLPGGGIHVRCVRAGSPVRACFGCPCPPSGRLEHETARHPCRPHGRQHARRRARRHASASDGHAQAPTPPQAPAPAAASRPRPRKRHLRRPRPRRRHRDRHSRRCARAAICCAA